MKIKTLLLAASSCWMLGTAAYAQNIIDQNQPNAPVYMAGFFQPDLAQSFQQSHNNVSGAGIFLQPHVGTSDDVTIALWSNLPNAGGTELASGTGLGTQGTWLDVFWSPVAVTPATTLFLVFTSANNTLGIAGDATNPYPSGDVYANSGYNLFSGYDYTFRTYYNAGRSSVPDVGSTLGLLSMAIVGLAAFKRKHA